jgi:glycosyltransferase involved in cell wall biosynthesis
VRIVLIAACPFPCHRGTPARVLAQATALAELGHDVRVVAYHLGDSEPPPGLPVERIVRIPTYRSLRPGPGLQKLAILDPLLAAKTLAVVRRERPDVLHAHHIEGAIVGLAVRAVTGVPVVFDAHTLIGDELPLYGPRPLQRWLRRAGRAVERFVAPRCDHVVAVTETLRSELLALCGQDLAESAVSVIPTGIDLPGASDEAIARNRARPPGQRIVYAGSLSRFQELDLLAEALETIRAELPEARLVIVSHEDPSQMGDLWSDLAPESIEYIKADGLLAVSRALAGADVAVSPRTARGGLPVKILNYMSMGLPTVASRGSADALEHGRTGLIVSNGDVEGFAASVVRLLRDPALARRLGDEARLEANGLGQSAMARRIISTYEATLGTERAPWPE